MRVMKRALKLAYLNYFGDHLDLNISIKLNEMLIDVFVVFFRVHGPFEASLYEINGAVLLFFS